MLDRETLEKRLERVKKTARTGNKDAQKELDVLLKVKDGLEAAISVRAIDFTEKEREEYIKPLQFITDKPTLYVCNVDEDSALDGNAYVDALKEAVKDENAEVIVLAVGTEADIAELDDYEERQMFLADIGLEEAGVDNEAGQDDEVVYFNCSNPTYSIPFAYQTFNQCGFSAPATFYLTVLMDLEEDIVEQLKLKI